MSDTKSQIQEAQKIPIRLNTEIKNNNYKTTPWHIIFKL